MTISVAKHGAVSITPGKPGKLEITGYNITPLSIRWNKINFIGKSYDGALVINGEEYPGAQSAYDKISAEMSRQTAGTK